MWLTWDAPKVEWIKRSFDLGCLWIYWDLMITQIGKQQRLFMTFQGHERQDYSANSSVVELR